jgi:hypothetical protein
MKPENRLKPFVHPGGSVVVLPKIPASSLRGIFKSRHPRPVPIAEMTDAAAQAAIGTRAKRSTVGVEIEILVRYRTQTDSVQWWTVQRSSSAS